MKLSISKVYRWCRRYVSVLLLGGFAFVVFLVFFNENSAIKVGQYNKEIARLEREIEENTDSLNHYLELNRSLDTDPARLEQIVRERYHMQRASEDVYVFDED